MTALLIIIFIRTILYRITTLRIKFKINKSLTRTFECGFNPLSPPITAFSIQFFKILILFLLFDLEIIILLPSPFFHVIDVYTITSILLIILIIIIGFIFEWKEGSLQWVF